MNPSVDLLSWTPVAEAPRIEPGDLHLWRIDAAGPGACGTEDEMGCLALLGTRQRMRAQRLSNPGRRSRYARAQAGLRRILGLYLDAPPGALDFDYGAAGKPRLGRAYRVRGTRCLEFNLTTSADLALVGVCLEVQIGVDCEWLRPRRDFDAIARRMFDPAVALALADLPPDLRPMAFYRAWTALEADAKADGRGLFRPRARDAPCPQVAHGIPAPGYVAAVARVALPPVQDWRTLTLSAGSTG